MQPNLQVLTLPFELEIAKLFCSGLPEGFDNVHFLISRDLPQQIDYAMTYYRFIGKEKLLDVPDPDFDIFDVVEKLINLLKSERVPWKEIDFKLSLNNEGNWKMKINYSYF